MASTTITIGSISSHHLGNLMIHGDIIRSSSSSAHVVVGLSTRLPCRSTKHSGYLLSSASSSSANQAAGLLHSFGTNGINLIRFQPAKRNTNMVVKSIESLSPGSPPPPSTPPPSGGGGPSGWFNWILWTLVPMLLPFMKNKWGPLLTLKKEVDQAIEVVECAAEMVEEVAEKVEKYADGMADTLPEDCKLKEALREVEHIAEEAIKGADFAEDLVKKAEAAEDKLEGLMEEAEKANIEEEKKVASQKS